MAETVFLDLPGFIGIDYLSFPWQTWGMSIPASAIIPMPPGWEEVVAEENGRIIRNGGTNMQIHFGLRNSWGTGVEINAQAPIPEMALLLRVIHRAINDALPDINAALPSHVPAFRLYEEGELV